MATYDIGRLREALPPDLLRVVERTLSNSPKSSPCFLDAVAEAALSPALAGPLLPYFEPVWADVAARWLLLPNVAHEVAAAFSRTLPLAPYLSVFFEKVAAPLHPDPSSAECLPTLVTLWRLVNFDLAYARFVPANLQTFFRHDLPPVRYVAIRIFCLIHSAADYKLESLLNNHIDGATDSLLADLDGVEADYSFLTLYEHTRCKALHDKALELRRLREATPPPSSIPSPTSSLVVNLTPLVSVWGRCVLPRPEPDCAVRPSTIVKTETTLENLEALAQCLQRPGPILLRGLPGSGKTSLVREVARELGMEDGLVTLHLNEQTDAKTLIGLYSTGAKPGSFQWRAGILTAAVQEGRWVLIEDLDRAPNEVMSTILPLIERRELLIPSRRETIKASRNFRIFATMRTTLGLNGQETTRSLLGERLWQKLSVQQLAHRELKQVIHESFPSIQTLIPDILSVFDQLTTSMSKKGTSSSLLLGIERSMTLRDLMKWCRRLEHTYSHKNQSTVGVNGKPNFASDGSLTETAWMGIFFEAVDCFAGSIKNEEARKFLGRHIAAALKIPSEVADHALSKHEPPFEDNEKQLVVGRARLGKSRRSANRISKPKGRPFATTAHARRLLEQIAVAVDLKEPLLLVGETGIGKTTVVQQLAESLGHKLVVVNLSQQSEVGDLLGGFKPVNTRSLAMPLKEEFEDLFSATGISTEKNEKYIKRITSSIAKGKWADVCRLWQQAPTMFTKILEQLEEKQASRSGTATPANGDGQPTTKRRKTESSRLKALRDLKPRWATFSEKLEQFDMQVSSGSGTFAFAFVEGKIVQAVRNGDWLLLDEINLASPDTLESIADLLSSGPGDAPSILLSETGEIDKIEAHAEFRVFGAMNPATDVGKRDLPIGLRSRFTELYVASPDGDVQDLAPIIKTYLKGQAKVNDRIVERVASLYLKIKELAKDKKVVDGANEVPHYSLRTLTRVLRYVDDVASYYGLERALFEGFCMGFLTLLNQESENLVMPEIISHLFGKISAKQRHNMMSQPPKNPIDGRSYVRFVNKDKDRQYWLMQGSEPPQERSDYIRTAYVERNLLNLVRATSTRRFPVLIQGPTSAGKTSMIEFLANFSGNKFVRINNHEHTDLQEYLGTYVSGADGKLRFQEGVLVQAMRQGHWIVLDELNLAPTDVLEALNRLLDDNRELLIPETQEIVRPHESFMLFATQNPPGLYGGRKVLSRAFRNRFLELHFDDIPENELGYILQMRCRNTAPSDCERIVAVYKELSRLRQTSRVFEQKNSFATLRDLFRWALRDADNRDQIACHGFMLLAERVRDEEERMAVKGVIEKIFKTKIDLETVYSQAYSPELRQFMKEQETGKDQQQQVVWTKAMRRLFVLVAAALRNHEPVLLVGETGCGKTTICQLVAEAAARELHIVNAHQNTETGDLIGSQRPVRNRAAITESLRRDLIEALGLLTEDSMTNTDEEASVDDLLEQYKAIDAEDKSTKLSPALVERIGRDEARSKALFEWSDGSLVHAMKTGSFFLLDEISLADDSVLERLNSVLEPQRTLLLAEKGVDDASIVAEDSFQFLATMNPGGDFGKKELSPALRNRFTEIWVPPLTDNDDVQAIVATTLHEQFRPLAPVIVAFSYWFGSTFRGSSATPFSIRDILVWAQFVNRCGQTASPDFALIHGAATVFIDTLGANPSAMVSADPTVAGQQRELCLKKLAELLRISSAAVSSLYRSEPVVRVTNEELWAGDFSIERAQMHELNDDSFEFEAPTTKVNVMRVVRAMQMNHKPVLLEGNPGVGKTTLISALARACGQPLTRINLSDQTDLMDLFGTDVPVEGAEAGNFAWRDAPFLQAMQRGEWVLLDEMNLASQTVLEGLNACLDHRGEVYIAELDQTFKRHKDFRLFAAQNPHHQGGGRKGLPSSFVNRFIVVYADVFTEADQLRIAHKRFPEVPADIVRSITNFVAALDREVVTERVFGAQGAPWEFNLRDTLRWLELASVSTSAASSTTTDPLARTSGVQDFLEITIRQRFRTARDRQEVGRLFESAFGSPYEPHSLYHNIGPSAAQVGFAMLRRNVVSQPTPDYPGLRAAPRLSEIESLLVCVKHNLPCILVGASGTGKTALLQHVAALAGKPLVVFPLSADVDAMDLVGGFEQADPVREVYASLTDLKDGLGLFLLENSDTSTGRGVETAEAAAKLMRALNLQPQSNKNNASDGEAAYFGHVADCISQLAPLISADSTLAQTLSYAFDRLQQPLTLENPRFEWLDSILVHAAQAGHWLVLDNANLCNASVLDRLNSLLERPNGFLSINEHNGPDGQPRIVSLHPEFRVFLTVDPRHGELSRAMRNRSVEIYLEEEEEEQIATTGEPAASQEAHFLQHITPVEARMQRFLDAISHASSSPLWLDNLTLADSSLLQRFLQAIEQGTLIKANGSEAQVCLTERLRAMQSFVSTEEGKSLRDDILLQYNEATQGSPEESTLVVRDQPVHPLQNVPLVQALVNVAPATQLAWWLAVRYEQFAGLFYVTEDLRSQHNRATANLSKLSMLTRLQRSSLSSQVAILARDSTSKAYEFLHGVIALVKLYIVDAKIPLHDMPGESKAIRYMLNVVWHIWKRTHSLTDQANFDEAKFQAHLSHTRKLLQEVGVFDDATSNPFQVFVMQVAQRVEEDFAAGFKLSTGLSIEVLWPALRPIPIPETGSYRQVMSMERLASRFDNLKWRVPAASVAELGGIMTAIAEAYRLLRVNSTDSASLVQALTDEISKLEAQVGDDQSGALPVFAEVFEAVRQLNVLYGTDSTEQKDVELGTLVLSDLPTVSQLRLRSSLDVAKQLQAVDYLLSQDSYLRPWSGALSGHLLRRCDRINSSTLASLRSLESEMPFLGKVVARSSEAIMADSVVKLNDALWDLIVAVVASHDPTLKTGLETLFAKASAHPQIGEVEIAEHGLVIAQSEGKSAAFPAEAVIWPGVNKTFSSDWPENLGHLAPIMQHHVLPAILALAASKQNSVLRQSLSSVAWVQFAVGCIKMYTPDKIFDPYLKWQTEQEFRTTLRDSLVDKSVALRQFENDFTSQDSVALRTKMVEEDISAVDATLLAEAQQQHTDIYRPQNNGAGNELSRLQKEVFNPVLDVVIKDNLVPAHYRVLAKLLSSESSGDSAEALQELQFVQTNIVRLIRRLLDGQFSAYQDLAVPVANLLRCLQLGLSLSESSDASKPEDDTLWLGVSPFLGGQLAQIETLPASASKKWEFLLYSGVCANIERSQGSAPVFSPEGRRRILESFHFFFEEWKRKAEAERRAEEAKNSLYRYRGSYEDEVEMDETEFAELFPTYDEDDEDADNGDSEAKLPKTTAPSTSLKTKWDVAAEVAMVHRSILSPSQPAADVILDFTKTIARKTAKENEVDGKQAFSANSANNTLLPAAMLALDDRLQSLQHAAASTTGTTGKGNASRQYNFYTDANLPEARKLVALVHDIQVHFRALRQNDEIGHLQPIGDVLVGSDKVLEVGFSEALAKVIPRVEKLHEFLNEWETRGYAPKKYCAPALYDRLTSTLISWRQLELSTWSRLFDAEAAKCRQEASDWWFVAYEAAVAAPMAILLGADAKGRDRKVLAYHAEQLLNELASYLAKSMAGQYTARLDLLRQIQAHLALLVADYPGMSVIHSALQSFISYHARYEGKAEEVIKKGRESLQKKMNDILFITSWRDRNIDALRESARKSHLKLFRIVRKFREVLGTSMEATILQGLPDEQEEELSAKNNVALPSSDRSIDLARARAAAQLCQQLVPGWGSDAHTRRLSTADRIVSLMAKAGRLPDAAVEDPANLVSEFVEDLTLSMASLRKETPSLLTEENKESVKHLKVRKVRLYEDTVKTVGHMGFSSNLGTTRLAAQGSLALVFSGFESTRLPGELDLAGLEYGFHKLLDLAPKFRDALHDHHSDLHRVVARRSVGYLEGILHVALNQRELLSRSAQGWTALDKNIAYIDNLSADAVASSDESNNTDNVQLDLSPESHSRSLSWLVSISQVALHLVEVHARLAAVDCHLVQAQLKSWIDTLEGLHVKLNKASPSLPVDFVTSRALEIRQQVDQERIAFTADLDAQIQARPDLAYILSQVKLWTGKPATGALQTSTKGNSSSLATFTEDALNLSKKVLDALQKFSKAVAELPRSTDDASWLVDYNTKLSAAIKSLHADTVVNSISKCIELLRSVYATPETSHVAAPALLQVLLPVLQQYASTYHLSLMQLAQLHRSTCHMGYRLSRAFVDLASQGFCSPQEKAEDDNSGQSGKLEEGTGLGDGDGAEDISKDVQPDEDLSELAQTANQEKDKDADDVEDEKDAIDMGTDEMEGEMGSAAGDDEEDDDKKDKDGDDDEEEDDMDEETGDVDDLDPTAVDEKMWDGEDDAEDKEDKEQQGNESKGQKNEEDDKSAAADENAKNQTADEKDAAAGEEGKEEEKGKEEDENEKGNDGEDGEEEDELGEEDEKAGPQQELNRQDQDVEQNDVLELPDDMVIEGEEDEDDGSDDGLDDLADLEREEGGGDDEEMDDAKEEKGGNEDDADEADDDMADDIDPDNAETVDKDAKENDEEDSKSEDGKEQDEDGMDVDEEAGGEDEAESPLPDNKEVHTKQNEDQVAHPDVQSGAGAENMTSAEDQEQQDSDVKNQNNTAQRDQGELGQDQDEDKNTMPGGDGKVAQRERDDEDPSAEDATKAEDRAEERQQQPFKKLGDVLERWHRTHREIRQAEEKLEPQDKSNNDANNEQADADQEFQHLYDESAEATTQAMGAADDEEAKPFDDAMAIDEEEDDKTRGANGDDDSKDADMDKHRGNEESDDVADEDMKDDGDDNNQGDDKTKKTDGEDDRTGVSMRKGAFDDVDGDEDEKMGEAEKEEENDDDAADIEEADDDDSQVASQLLSTHLDDSDEDDLVPLDEAVRQWAAFQTETHALSLALAAQLRLILSPSQATRLSGGFRTGKRLSIRKIIPYIASGYKRDKIWMRRSVPTKRAYQILLCVDDSQSMAEVSSASGPGSADSAPGHLALSSLVMVARSLAMLEAGQVGVLGFGGSVFAAHELLGSDGGPSFAAMGQSDVRGAEVLRRFTFRQPRTNVALLLRETISRFQAARYSNMASSAGAASADLWQLAIVLSDGLTESSEHERIRPLLREAAESRIMVVFVVLDGSAGSHKDGKSSKSSSSSVLDLKVTKFVKDEQGMDRVLIERYLDTFPFPYYLIVHDLADLPSALAGLLRTWFAEVNA